MCLAFQGARTLSDWEFVKTRTASDGTVWRSPEGLFYKRTGTSAVRAEAHHCPMLEIVPFKGGTKGYAFTADQRDRYLAELDQAALGLISRPLRGFLGEFLLVKCFFFLALMRPAQDSRPDKYTKWRYRRALFEQGLEQYESSGAIQTDAFPTLAAFTERLAHADAGGA